MPNELLRRVYLASIRNFSRHSGKEKNGVPWQGCRLCGGEWLLGAPEQHHTLGGARPCPIKEIKEGGYI